MKPFLTLLTALLLAFLSVLHADDAPSKQNAGDAQDECYSKSHSRQTIVEVGCAMHDPSVDDATALVDFNQPLHFRA